jgi:hypothetical protein
LEVIVIMLNSKTGLLLASVSVLLLACGGGGGGNSAVSDTSSSGSNSSSSGSTSSSSGSTSSSTSSSSGSTSSSTSSSSGSTSSSSSGGASLGSNAKIIFLHHSTGDVIWGGGVPSWFNSYNTAHSTSYQISQLAFPSGTSYPWENYPYDYWNIWLNHGGGASEPSLETLTAQYNVIIWKHCFPGSDIGPDTGSANVSSSNKTLENYKLQYAALKTKMHAFPNTRFIVWTGAARIQSETDAASAARAQQFADWVKNTWDEKGDNIFVWDFRQLETEGVDGGRYLLAKYAQSDSHPNSTLANAIAPYFAQRIVDVIEGRGDPGSITGH